MNDKNKVRMIIRESINEISSSFYGNDVYGERGNEAYDIKNKKHIEYTINNSLDTIDREISSIMNNMSRGIQQGETVQEVESYIEEKLSGLKRKIKEYFVGEHVMPIINTLVDKVNELELEELPTMPTTSQQDYISKIDDAPVRSEDPSSLLGGPMPRSKWDEPQRAIRR